MANVSLWLVTLSAGDAPGYVRTLVEEGTIACGNIVGPVRSIYRWQGDTCDEEEVLLVMESGPDTTRVQERLAEIHPYEVPKIIGLSPTAVTQAYAAWVEAETKR